MKENILHVSTLHSANSARIFHKYIKVSRDFGICDAYLCGQITKSDDQIHRFLPIKQQACEDYTRFFSSFLS